MGYTQHPLQLARCIKLRHGSVVYPERCAIGALEAIFDFIMVGLWGKPIHQAAYHSPVFGVDIVEVVKGKIVGWQPQKRRRIITAFHPPGPDIVFKDLHARDIQCQPQALFVALQLSLGQFTVSNIGAEGIEANHLSIRRDIWGVAHGKVYCLTTALGFGFKRDRLRHFFASQERSNVGLSLSVGSGANQFFDRATNDLVAWQLVPGFVGGVDKLVALLAVDIGNQRRHVIGDLAQLLLAALACGFGARLFDGGPELRSDGLDQCDFVGIPGAGTATAYGQRTQPTAVTR